VQTSPVDARCLAPLLTAALVALGANPKEVSADAGFCTDKNLAYLARRRIDAFVATGRVRHGQPNSGGKRWRRGSRIAAMATKFKRAGRRSRYRLRKQIVELRLFVVEPRAMAGLDATNGKRRRDNE
jgi:hypothetical protein